MSIKENVSLVIQWYKTEHGLSLYELSKELGIPMSSAQCYLKGTSNLRADTLEMLANKMGIPIIEMISGPAPGREQAEIIIRAAKELGTLTPDRRTVGTRLFLELVVLFAGNT